MASSASMVAAKVDLVEEIMSWLPSKSVIRFKTVCKQWRDCLSSRVFAATHTRRNPGKVAGLLYNVSPYDSKMLYEASCPLEAGASSVFPESCALRDYASNQILQSCNGLLLGTGVEVSAQSSMRRHLWVCNPTTKQHRIISSSGDDVKDAVMAFDPSRSTNYRVIFSSSFSGEIKVYNSEDGSTDTISDGVLPHATSYEPWVCCFCNGVVYWLYDYCGPFISFHIEQRCVNVDDSSISLPPMHKAYSSIKLYESRGSLHLLRCKLGMEVLEVLEMRSDPSSWVRLHKVCVKDVLMEIYGLTPDQLRLPPSLIFHKAFGIVAQHCCLVEGEEEEDDRFVVGRGDKNIVAYNLRRGTHEVILTTSNHNNEDDQVDGRAIMLCSCTSTLAIP